MRKQLLLVIVIAIIILSTAFAGCSAAPSRPTATATSVGIPLPGGPTAEPTLNFQTLTAKVPVKNNTPTATPSPEIPETFTILLEFVADTVCGGAPFAYEYEVTISGDALSLLQLNAGFTSTGPYDRSTGEFTTTLPNMPGTETYTGAISASFGDAGQTVVNMDGNYGYGQDTNYCGGDTSSQDFTGTTNP